MHFLHLTNFMENYDETGNMNDSTKIWKSLKNDIRVDGM